MKIKGTIQFIVDGEVILKQSNTIHADLKNYLIGRLTSDATDKALDNFIASDGLQAAVHTGKDGIVVKTSANTFVMVSQEEAVAATNKKRFKGTLSYGSTLGIEEAQIGHDLKSEANGDAERFVDMYAEKNLASTLILNPNQPLNIIWELEITKV